MAIYSEFVTIRVSYHHSCLTETQRQREERESFIMKKRKGFRYALIRSYWHVEAGGGLTKSGTSYESS